jgi:hypothetical protein
MGAKSRRSREREPWCWRLDTKHRSPVASTGVDVVKLAQGRLRNRAGSFWSGAQEFRGCGFSGRGLSIRRTTTRTRPQKVDLNWKKLT